MEKTQNINKRKNEMSFNDRNHFYGRIFMAIAIVIIIGIPTAMAIILKVSPNWSKILESFIPLIVFIVGGFIEVTTYAPLLGTSGTYLGFFTGNLVNLKVPCAVNTREATGYQIGTKEAEIVSTLSVGASTIITTIIIALGVALLVPLTPIINSETLKPAFNTAFTALFGSLAYKYFVKDIKLVPVPLVLALALAIFLNQGTSILIPVCAVISILFAYYLFKKKK